MITIRKERALNGMIADPAPLNENNNVFAGTLNGDMQRDNIPLNGITADMIEPGAFNRVITDTQTTTLILDSTSQQWQVVQSISDTADTDSMLDIEWSGGFKVISRGSNHDSIQFNLTVNGVEVATTGWFGFGHEWACAALSGTTPVQTGPIVIEASAMVAEISDEFASPGLFAILNGVDSDYYVTERELIVIVESC